MWYVIHTCVGYEQELAVRLDESLDHESCMECLVPIYEDVKRSGGVSRISYKKLFPGYVLIDTEHPENVWIKLRNIDNYTRMLGLGRTEDGEKIEEEEIIKRILKRAAELGRTDDTPEVAKNRTAQYFKLTHPLIEYYQKQGKLIEINGMQTIDEVFADICKALDN